MTAPKAQTGPGCLSPCTPVGSQISSGADPGGGGGGAGARAPPDHQK